MKSIVFLLKNLLKEKPGEKIFSPGFMFIESTITKHFQTDYYKALHRSHFSKVVLRDFHFQ